MRLERDLEAAIIRQIHEHPERAIVLPDWAYWKGRNQPIVYPEGLPTKLSRYLYEKVVGPLPYNAQLILRDGVHPRNVNPLLFVAEPGRHRGETCPNGHAYAGNEMPDNSMGWRCRTCYVAWLEKHSLGRLNQGQLNARKTHCPQNHPYDEDNTIYLSNGRRRCRICNAAQSAAYAARRAA